MDPVARPDGDILYVQLWRGLQWLIGDIGLTLLAIALVYVQALLLNNIVNGFKFHSQTNFITALTYITLMALVQRDPAFESILIANTLVIPFLSIILSVYKKQFVFLEVFDAGLLIGVASLIYWPTALLMLVFMISTAVLRPISLREWVIGWSGFFVPYVLTAGVYLVLDQFGQFIELALLDHKVIASISLDLDFQILVKLFLMALFMFWSILKMQASMSKSSIQMRKNSVILLWFLMIGVFAALLQEEIRIRHLILLVLGLRSLRREIV
jgi:hypothetical protein